MPLYDDRFRLLIANAIRANVSPAEIVEQCRVSKRMVYKYRKKIELFNVHNPPPISIPYRYRKIYVTARESLVDILVGTKTIHLDEI